MVRIAESNAKNAWILDLISFKQIDFFDINFPYEWKSWIVCNPPYGKRLHEKRLSQIYEKLDNFFNYTNYWWWISSYPYKPKDLSNWWNKKLYNWAEECIFYWRNYN
jgi:23S rRNA G2445 N2-methylase RlmL